MKQSDFWQIFDSASVYNSLCPIYRFFCGFCQTSQVCECSFARSPRSIDPGGISLASLIGQFLLPAM